MGRHKELARESYWGHPHQLGRIMPIVRFQQISRYFTIRDSSISPRQPNKSYFWRLEPVASLLRDRFLYVATPLTYVVVDKAIQLVKGHTLHKTKCSGKPVNQGLKMWVLAYANYVVSFLFHSGSEGPEGC